MAVGAPAAGEVDHDHLAGKSGVGQRNALTREVGKRERERLPGLTQRRDLSRVAERGTGVAPRREPFVRGEARPEFTGELRAFGLERRMEQEHVAAVEGRKIEPALAQLAREVTVVAGGCEERAGDVTALLAEFADRDVGAAIVFGERDGPTATDIASRCRGLREEAWREAGLRGEGDALVCAAGLHEEQFALQRAVGRAPRGDAVLEAGQRHLESAVVEPQFVYPQAFGAIDDVGYEPALFTRDVQAERQLAARNLQHGAIAGDPGREVRGGRGLCRWRTAWRRCLRR